jgi:lipopolysaccharide biosynthesis glycosyltransferase
MERWKTRLSELATTTCLRIPAWRPRMLRQLAAGQRWADVYRLAIPHLANLSQQAAGLEPVVEAARQTGKSRELWMEFSRLSKAGTPGLEIVLKQLEDESNITVERHVDQRLQEGDFGTAVTLLREHQATLGTLPKSAALRVGSGLVRERRSDLEPEFFRILRESFPGDNDIATLELSAALRDRDWPRAAEIYWRDLANSEPQDENLRLARIRILVNTGRPKEASELLERERVDGLYPRHLLGVACVFHSERGEHADLYELAIRQLAELPNNPHVLYVLVRAARKTGRVRDLWERLSALPGPRSPEMERVRRTLLEDLADTGIEIEGLDGADRLLQERADRIRLKAPQPVVRLPTAPRIAILYCTDAGFLRPTLVSLVSLCLSNPLLVRNTRITLAADAAVFETASRLAGILGPSLGAAVDVVNAAHLVPDPSQLRADYGFFTGGATLSLAAYYRIFLARHLLARNVYQQALYLDADTLIRPGLAELLECPRQNPLMARPEVDRPEVRRAVAEHGLRGWYFNSGVLRFDFQHPEIGRALDKSLQCALDPGRRLLFQDQCALNLGFEEQVDPLPERFNHFLPPAQALESAAFRDAVVLHFVDQPKPWDNYYPTPATAWFEALQVVQNLLGTEFPPPR